MSREREREFESVVCVCFVKRANVLQEDDFSINQSISMYSTCGGGGIDAFVLPSLSMLSFKGIGVGDLANKRFRSRASSLVFCFFTKF